MMDNSNRSTGESENKMNVDEVTPVDGSSKRSGPYSLNTASDGKSQRKPDPSFPYTVQPPIYHEAPTYGPTPSFDKPAGIYIPSRPAKTSSGDSQKSDNEKKSTDIEQN